MSRDELLLVVGRQSGQLAEQAEQLAARDRQIAGMAGQLADLMEANEALAARLARLEHLLSRNSGNSSSPPSRDDDPGKPPAPGKPKRGSGPARARGKQPGAPGSHLAWTDDPHERRDRFPTGHCDCGADLADAADGTAEAVTQHHPDVRLLRGDGHLYWNGGMRRALDQAMAGDYDYYLWTNDDTTLVDNGVLALLLHTEQQLRERSHGPVILAGTTPAPTDRPTHLRRPGPPLPPAPAEMDADAARQPTTTVRDYEREHRPGPAGGGATSRQHRPRLYPPDG